MWAAALGYPGQRALKAGYHPLRCQPPSCPLPSQPWTATAFPSQAPGRRGRETDAGLTASTPSCRDCHQSSGLASSLKNTGGTGRSWRFLELLEWATLPSGAPCAWRAGSEPQHGGRWARGSQLVCRWWVFYPPKSHRTFLLKAQKWFGFFFLSPQDLLTERVLFCQEIGIWIIKKRKEQLRNREKKKAFVSFPELEP